jgi:hypothetical protein
MKLRRGSTQDQCSEDTLQARSCLQERGQFELWKLSVAKNGARGTGHKDCRFQTEIGHFVVH